jgi:hypothetical protein
MASPAEDLADSIKSSAEKKVGGKAVGGGKDKGGIDCFALVDELLKSTGGKRPKSIGKRVSEQEYARLERVAQKASKTLAECLHWHFGQRPKPLGASRLESPGDFPALRS